MRSTSIFIVSILLIAANNHGFGQKMPRNHGRIESSLFPGEKHNKYLIVAFGGSEGGNTFATEQTQDVRRKFHDRGFDFLSINYFGSKGLPKTIDRISLTSIYDTIINVSKRRKILSNNIVLMGASRGGELILNLAGKYDFKGVIALVPASVTVANTSNKSFTSSWTFNDEDILFLDINEELLKKEGWFKALEQSLKNQEESSPAYIPVEDINGFVFLSSGKKDGLWPSFNMCNYMIMRMEKNNFNYPFMHKSFEGGHNPSSHWSAVLTFLDERLREDLEGNTQKR